ncbi:MAG: hypothetical protein H0T14_08360 [Nocardioidaceae bacterium]|nr:hypothetical protein [Nocardioidaceae bacterium]
MWIQTSVAALAVSCAGLALGSATASAGGSVDPSTLVPEPPPDATCKATGAGVVCNTTFNASVQNEPAFSLPCGLLYETADDVRRGTRWYVDGRLTRRFVFQNASGSWSLSPTGAGPSVTWVAHANWQNTDVDADAPEETWPTVIHGMMLRITGPTGRPIFQYAGIERPDGTSSGLGDWAEFEAPQVQSEICDALTN